MGELRMIWPTSTAPYALRFVEETLAPGAYAVDFVYRLAYDGFAAIVTRRVGSGWARLGETRDVLRRLDEEDAERIAADLIASYRSDQERELRGVRGLKGRI